MSRKSAEREEFERSDPQVSWQTYRKRVSKLHWNKHDAISLPPNAKPSISELIPQDKLNVSVSTVLSRLRNKQFQKRYPHTDTRLRRAVQNTPHNWPSPGTTYHGWVIMRVRQRDKLSGESAGARAVVQCELCHRQVTYLLKYLRNSPTVKRCCRQSET